MKGVSVGAAISNHSPSSAIPPTPKKRPVAGGGKVTPCSLGPTLGKAAAERARGFPPPGGSAPRSRPATEIGVGFSVKAREAAAGNASCQPP